MRIVCLRPLLGFVFLLLLLLTGCGDSPSDKKHTLFVFGTLLEIQAYTSKNDRFQQAVSELEQLFQQMHRDWHAWKGEGELVRLNRALQQGAAFAASPALVNLLQQAKSHSIQSEDLFNPAIGRFVALWGFHSDELPNGAPPDAQAIRELVAAAPNMRDIDIAQTQIQANNPHVALDLGGFAKGYALKLAINRLKAKGIEHAIVNAGGDLCVSGRHGDRPWRIGIRHPQGTGVIASLAVQDGECVLTSGNYERYREHQGIRYSHILDPRTGYPVAHVASVTVISEDGGLADAAATALSVAGPDAWQRIAKRMSLDQVMLVDETGQVFLTPAMQARIRFETTVADVIVAEP